MKHQSFFIKARLQKRFLSRQLDAIFVAEKLHQVANMFETPAISRRQIELKSHLVYTCDFEVATLARQKMHRVAATKIACVNGPLTGYKPPCTNIATKTLISTMSVPEPQRPLVISMRDRW